MKMYAYAKAYLELRFELILGIVIKPQLVLQPRRDEFLFRMPSREKCRLAQTDLTCLL